MKVSNILMVITGFAVVLQDTEALAIKQDAPGLAAALPKLDKEYKNLREAIAEAVTDEQNTVNEEATPILYVRDLAAGNKGKPTEKPKTNAPTVPSQIKTVEVGDSFTTAKGSVFNNKLKLADSRYKVQLKCDMQNSFRSNSISLKIGDNENYMIATLGTKGIRFNCKGSIQCVRGFQSGIQALVDWNLLQNKLDLNIEFYPDKNMLVVWMPNSKVAEGMVAFQHNGFNLKKDSEISVSVGSLKPIKVAVESLRRDLKADETKIIQLDPKSEDKNATSKNLRL